MKKIHAWDDNNKVKEWTQERNKQKRENRREGTKQLSKKIRGNNSLRNHSLHKIGN